MRSSPAGSPPTRPKSPLPSIPSGASLFLISCFIYYAGRAPFIGQWDSFDYLKQIVTHRLSDLAFGRPVFIGYNILLWEASKRLFGLSPLQVDIVATAGIILIGGLGVLLFRRLARNLLPTPLSRMAALAFLLSPMYAVYAGSVMTEVPMLVAVVSAAVVLWESGASYPALGPLAGGFLFGLAVGIREQAATLGAACLWILWERRPDLPARLRAWFLFFISAGATMVIPILALYVYDPARFIDRTRTWLQAIPTGEIHLLKNVQAALFFTLTICPGVWLALTGGVIICGSRLLLRGAKSRGTAAPHTSEYRTVPDVAMRCAHPGWGFFCGFVLPMVVLWRDADVQMHPRYLLILLPAALLTGTWLYGRRFASAKGVVAWAIIQIAVFGLAATALEPMRQVQREKREFAELVRASIPDEGLLVAGGFSPVLDYYRSLGDRPGWKVLWSGWGWNRSREEATIREAWSRHEPVYLCDAPYGWLMLEDERLDIHFILKDCCREVIAPGIMRYYPRISPKCPGVPDRLTAGQRKM